MKMVTLDLTDDELGLILACVGERLIDLEESGFAPDLSEEILALIELDMDLREALHRQDDGWGEAHVEAQFIQSGIDAREQQKATSRAATRRDLRANTLVLSGKTNVSD
jgi:hypothetical protein